MAKEDDVILIISKSFSEQKLSNKELELCKDLSISKLIINFGLNDMQASKVVSWCCMQQKYYYTPEEAS